MTGLPLFDALDRPPAQRHSPTSCEAADSIAPAINELQRRVLAYIASCAEGATDEQIIDGTGLSGNTVRPRRGELLKRGYIRDTGLARLTRSKRRATVWAVGTTLRVEGDRVEAFESLAEAENK